METLETINKEICTSEQNSDADYFDKLLSDDFLMRRGDGSLNNKKEFLINVKNKSPFSTRDSDLIWISKPDQDGRYVCISIVRTNKDTPSGSEIAYFKNVRFFKAEANTLKLYAWFNEKI